MPVRDIAVVVPYFQRKPGLLQVALRSAFMQTIADRIVVLVVDDGSPLAAAQELAGLNEFAAAQVRVITRPNGGAGAARNTALDQVPPEVEFVAFLDSDDSWRPRHLENAMHVLGLGFDAHFADWCSYNFPGQTNFERIGALRLQDHRTLDDSGRFFALGVTPIEHIVRDGGGVVQTSTVVYRHRKFPALRFREEFYNGQDFFFWMDLGELGARFAFSVEVECDNGEGINIYQGSGWGTERSLQRLRNELFVWTSVRRFYPLSPELARANHRTVRNLQDSVYRDVFYRLRRGLPVSTALLRDIIRFDASILALAPLLPLRIAFERLARRNRKS